MIHDFRAGHVPIFPPHATLVVGAGAAGLAVALTLVDAGRHVVLLESGGDIGDTAAAHASGPLNDAAQTGIHLDGVRNGRARMLGGTTSLWHGQCMRLHDIDLARRPWVAHSGWPLAGPDLERHYPEAEKFLGVSGLGYGAERWQRHGNLVPVAWNERRLLHDFTEYTPEPHLGRVHRRRLQTDPRIDVLLNATAGRVVLDGQRACGVEVLAQGCPRQTIAATSIVLAGGAIENARLLMLSDPAGVGLGDGREHTGRYYQDHPVIRTARIVPKDFRVLQDRYIALHRGGRKLFPKVRLAPAAQREDGLLDATAVFVHDHDDPARAALRRLRDTARGSAAPRDLLRDIRLGLSAPLPLLRDAYRHYAKGWATGAQPSAVWLQLWIEQQPDADSRIRLGEALDPLGLRQALVHWRCSDLELHTSRRLTRWITEDLQRLGIADAHDLPAMSDDDAWRGAVGDAAHPAGTTRMSAHADDGVVDTRLQVHGVHGLHVAGSSVFPICGYANPTLTIVALAIRLAHRLKQPDVEAR